MGCAGDQYIIDVVDAPSEKDAGAAVKWWEEKIDRGSPEFLAVLSDVSEIHKQHGTTASYIDFFEGHTGLRRPLGAPPPVYYYKTCFRVPLPEAAQARIKARLAKNPPFAKQAPDSVTKPRWPFLVGHGGEGCSDDEAQEIWDRVLEQHGWCGDQASDGAK